MTLHPDDHHHYLKGKPLLFDVVLVFFAFVVLASLAFAWRVSYAPLDVSFLKAGVEQALSDKETGRRVAMDGVVVHWAKIGEPLLLGLKNARIYNAEDEEIFAVDEVGLGLSKRYLLLGMVRPKMLVIKRPSLTLIRTRDGVVDFGFGSVGALSEPVSLIEDEEVVLDRILSALLPQGGSDSSLSFLRQVRIDNANLLFEDRLVGHRFYFSDVRALFSKENDGVGLEVTAQLEGLVGQTALPRLYFDGKIDPRDKRVNVRGALSDFPVARFANLYPALEVLRGQDIVMDIGFAGQLDEHLYPKDMTVKLGSAGGKISLPQLYDRALPYEDFAIGFSYKNGQGKHVNVKNASVKLDGVSVVASGKFDTDMDNATGALRIDLPQVDHAQIPPLWPKTLEGENIELWVVNRLSEGRFKNSYAALDFSGKKDAESGWHFALNDVDAQFDFEGMSIDYRAPLQPAKQAVGQGRFNYKAQSLDIDITSAKIGMIDASESHLRFAGIMDAAKATADIGLSLSGAVGGVFDYIASEPIAFVPDFDVTNTQGQADLAVKLHFPTLKNVSMADVGLDISGAVSGAVIPDLVRGMTLAGQVLDVQIKDNIFKASGRGATLDGRPLDVSYEAFLSSAGQAYKSKADLSLQVDDALRQKFGVDLSDYLEGDVFADILYTEGHDGRSDLDIRADIARAKFKLEPFAYEKPAGQAGRIDLQVSLKDGSVVRIDKMTGIAPAFKAESVRIDFDAGENLRAMHIPALQVGLTRGSGGIEVDAAGVWNVNFKADSFDLRPFAGAGKANSTHAESAEAVSTAYTAPPMRISLQAQDMLLDDVHPLYGGELFLDIDAAGGFNRLEMDARAGQGAVYLRYKPDDATGQKNFRFEADDAGATLAALGLYNNIRGGKIVVYAEPIRGVSDRNLIGLAEMTDFKVVKAPALARLLSFLSISGIGDLLQNEGLSFSKLEANFDWLYRPNGSLLVLQNGRTSGNSVGLTFDGIFDQEGNRLDVSGTVVPMSGVNTAIGSIPVIGNILTGGAHGAIFAATYKVKGKADDPDVSVNPLSVLAPGILRRLLFE